MAKKESDKELNMSAETAYLIFQTCLKNAGLKEERLWPQSLALKLKDKFKTRKPTPDLVFLREKLNDIEKARVSDKPYPTVAFRMHFFDILLEYSKLNFQDLETRFAKPEPPSDYQSLVFKNNIPPIFKEYQPLENLLWRVQMSLCNGLYPVTGIHGMPGMGKSFLAFHYAAVNYLRYPGGCWFVPASGNFNFRRSLRNLAETEWGLIYSEVENKDETLAWRKTKKYLEYPYTYNVKHQTLLIFDNVEDLAESFSDVLIDENRIDHVHILLTTRTPSQDNRHVDWVATSGLSRQESRELLKRFRHFGEADAQFVDAIFDRIGGFALALALIGSLLDKNLNIGYSDILTDLESGEIRFLDHSGARMKDLPGHYEQKVLSLLLRPLLEGLSEEAMSALDYMAQLPADNLPLPWVEELIKKQFAEAFPTPFYKSDLSVWQQLVEEFKRLSLINATSDPKVVRMHRLLQEVILHEPARSSKQQAAENQLKPYVRRLTDLFKANPHAATLRWQLQVLIAICEKDRIPGEENANFSNSLGVIEQRLGEFKQAERFFQRAISFSGASTLTEDTCIFYANLSIAKRTLGAYQESHGCISYAIGMAETHFSPNHPLLAGLYADLGETELELTNHRAANLALKKALKIKKQQGGEPDGELANIFAKQGLVERQFENYGEAKGLLMSAVGIAIKYYPPDDIRLGPYYSYMALIEQNLFNYSGARNWLLKSLEVLEATLDPTHPDLANGYTSMAELELETGDLPAAKKILTKAMVIEQERYDSGHPILGNSYFLMGSIEKAGRNFEAAKMWLTKACEIDEKLYPAGHYRLLKVYSSLGVIEMDLKNHVDAKIWLHKVALVIHRTYKLPLANFAVCLSNIGMIELELSHLDEAKKWLTKAIEANRQKYQPGHPAHALTFSNIGIVCYRRGELAEARDWMSKAVEICRNFPEKERLKVGNYYFTLGLIENAAGDLDEAKRWFLEALTQNKLVPGADIKEAIFSMTQISTIEQRLGNLTAAREWMQRSIELEEELKGNKKDEELAISYTNIGLIDLYQGKYLPAKRWFRKAIAINEQYNDPFHYRLGLNYFYLGLAEIDTDDNKAGCALLHKAYPIIVNTVGKDHQTAQQCLAALRKNCDRR